MLSLVGAVLVAALVGGLFGGCATVRPARGTKKMTRVMETTGYCKCGKCCGWKRRWFLGKPRFSSGPSRGKRKKVGVTASGVKAKPQRTIAADTRRYPFGTVMYVPGWGYGRVEDRGGAIKGEKIDLYFKSHKQALKWGRVKKKVVVWK